ncbi:thioredoxin [Micromonospora globbae]|jgi:thioredoxin 1|uniref:Thioredoxin n=1 Tax=Micromonospora globbae TaxID=1894969 RepID=A0A420F4B1_9ACTN|nr:thioredoxin [Micromonospora globbae]RKF27753.1 thioredoxin [Micromonospora globbae]
MSQVAPHALTAVTDGTFASTVLAADRPVVVDVWAEWCPPCHAISRSLAELAEEFAGRLTIVTVNSDENPEVTRRYRVLSLPTLLVFRHGELVDSLVGARPKAHLRQALARCVGE